MLRPQLQLLQAARNLVETLRRLRMRLQAAPIRKLELVLQVQWLV
jgi:hypothetical protein